MRGCYQSCRPNANVYSFAPDSIAGQMQALKTGQAPKPKKARKPSESSTEESDTEGDAGDTSDTNTETEDED